MKKIAILLFEDNYLLRDGIITILKQQKDFNIVAASGSKTDTITKLKAIKPDIILMDLGLRNLNSLNIVEIVRKDFSSSRIIIMDLSPAEGDILKYVKAGASGFIMKDATLEEFLSTIRSVASGGKVLPEHLLNSLFSQIIQNALQSGKNNINNAVKMTKREKEIISLVAEGISNKEIGKILRISGYTVKSHIHNIMEKLTLHTRLEVANYSLTGGTLKALLKDITTIT